MHIFAALSLRNRALVALVTIIIAVFGGIALVGLRQELAPSIEFPQLSIVTSYQGATPEVVSSEVSDPIETAIKGIAGLESTSSTSSTGSSTVTARFNYGTDLAFAEQKLLSAVERVRPQLPDDLDPQVLALSLNDLPVVQVAATGASDMSALSDEIQRTTLGEVQQIAGVRTASLIGDVGRRVTITPNPAALSARGLTTAAMSDALQKNGVLIPAGQVTENDQTLTVQVGTKLTSVADIAGLPLVRSTQSGSTSGAPQLSAPSTAPLPPTTIADVARVELADNPANSISRVNGQPAVTIAVTKLPSANTVAVSKDVRAALPDLQASLASSNPGTTLTVVFDQAPYIQKSIESLATEGTLGLMFAIVVILLFLLSVRATIITAISIPTSVLITFIGLFASGYTLNILTLGALTIAIGRVVDDSIVVTENIQRHLTAVPTRTITATATDRIPSNTADSAEVPGSAESAASAETDKVATIIRAVKEVAGAITASTITTVAVFLPIAFVDGVTGELFRPFSLTITIALVASLFVSLTIVPVLAYWFLRPRKTAGAAGAFVDEVEPAPEPVPTGPRHNAETTDSAARLRHAHGADAAPATSTVTGGVSAAVSEPLGEDELEHPSRLQRGYLPVIGWTLRHAVITLIIAVLVLIGTGAMLPLLKTNFLGSSGQNTFVVNQTLPPGTSLQALDAASRSVEQTIRDTPGVEVVQTSVASGRSVLGGVRSGSGNAVSYSVTTDTGGDQTAIQGDVRAGLDRLGGEVGELTLTVSSGFGASNTVNITVTGPNQSLLQTAADSVLNSMRALPEVLQATSNLSASRPYLAVTVDRAAAARAGYSETALGALVSAAMQPQRVGQVVIDEKTLTVYTDPSNPATTRAEVAAIPVPTSAGPVRLDTLATVTEATGPTTITTDQGLRSATVTVTPASDDLSAVNSAVNRAITEADLPAGTSAKIGGVLGDQSEAFSQLGLALLLAILIVYIVMVATFRSLLQPLLLLVSIPFAATGAIALQVITGIPLGVASLIGVLMLVGIVVTNAIVLIDLVNQYRGRGMTVAEALRHGGSRRLRPILMTALATIFALLPMALGLTGQSGFIAQPLALVVIGGLLSSTALTLVVLPALYYTVEHARERRALRRDTRTSQLQPTERAGVDRHDDGG